MSKHTESIGMLAQAKILRIHLTDIITKKKKIGKPAIQFDQKIKKEMEDLWEKQLEKQ